ncbi:hypothetical protein ABK040_001005 [Willaertia magna]
MKAFLALYLFLVVTYFTGLSFQEPAVTFPSSYSVRVTVQERSKPSIDPLITTFKGFVLKYNNSDDFNYIIESSQLAFLSLLDSSQIHSFYKSIPSEDGSNTTSPCIHVNYNNAPQYIFSRQLNVLFSQMFSAKNYEKEEENLFLKLNNNGDNEILRSYDQEVNEKCIKQRLTILTVNAMNETFALCVKPLSVDKFIPFYLISQNLVVTLTDFNTNQVDIEHEKYFLSQMSNLVENCNFIDRNYASAKLKDKNSKVIMNTQPKENLQNIFKVYKTTKSISSLIKNTKKYTSEKLPQFITKPQKEHLWFLSPIHTCKLSTIRDPSACPKETVNENKPTCIFLHGAGEMEELPPQKTFTKYWGDVIKYTPQCGDYWFGRRDTKTNGWDVEELQKYYCEVALLGSGPNTTTIKNTIVFTHSMGNLILASGIDKGFCKFDLNTSSWYTLAAPFHGSKIATALGTICYDYYHNDFPFNLKALLGFIATVGNYCKKNSPDAYPAYSTLLPTYCSKEGICINELYAIADPLDKGRICGDSPIGLLTHYSLALEVVSWVANYGTQNDGLVPFPSCQMDEQKEFYSNGPSVEWYGAYSNHADITCRNGDGWFGGSRKPCSFYTNKV